MSKVWDFLKPNLWKVGLMVPVFLLYSFARIVILLNECWGEVCDSLIILPEQIFTYPFGGWKDENIWYFLFVESYLIVSVIYFVFKRMREKS